MVRIVLNSPKALNTTKFFLEDCWRIIFIINRVQHFKLQRIVSIKKFKKSWVVLSSPKCHKVGRRRLTILKQRYIFYFCFNNNFIGNNLKIFLLLKYLFIYLLRNNMFYLEEMQLSFNSILFL
jgi:hypothetical protein